jgi:Tol biopolymer transport system component
MEPNGAITARITNEAAPITYFDVSPVDGSLAYVSNNQLIVSDAQGQNPRTLVFGDPLDPNNFDQRINQEISHPHWSPDGTHISYGLNGINIISLTEADVQTVLQSDPVPDLANGRPQTAPRFFFDALWSPDGRYLLINFSYWPEGGGYAIKDLVDGTIVEINFPSGITCCNPHWTADSQAVYFSNDSLGLVHPGLWRAEASTGNVAVLVETSFDSGGTTFPQFASAAQLIDGQLYYFYADGQLDPNSGSLPWPSQLSLARADPDGVTDRVQLRADTYGVGESLWSPDARGVVIWQVTDDPNGYGHGPLAWLDTANNPAVDLHADGSQLHWGK